MRNGKEPKMNSIKRDCKYYGTEECKSKEMDLIICDPCDKYKDSICPECGSNKEYVYYAIGNTFCENEWHIGSLKRINRKK